MKQTKKELIELLKSIGEITESSFKLIHTTHEEKTVEKIKENGFNLRNFGKTGRMYRAPESLTRYDPKGIFAMELENEDLNEKKPHVIFSVNEVTAIKNTTLSSTEFKSLIWNTLSADSHEDVSKKLKLAGIDIIETKLELIVINLKKIEIDYKEPGVTIKKEIKRRRRNTP